MNPEKLEAGWQPSLHFEVTRKRSFLEESFVIIGHYHLTFVICDFADMAGAGLQKKNENVI